MSDRWLVLDTNYLCHRAFYSMGHLTHGDMHTGTVFGVLRDVVSLSEELDANRVAFCFDSKSSLRKEAAPTYKSGRVKKIKEQTEEEHEAWLAFRQEIQHLRRRYLPFLGYKNVFVQRGYEADDMIAMVLRQLDSKDEGIIVSSDHDLYQLLAHNVWMYDPNKKKAYTHEKLAEEYYGIDPYQWAEVKAIAGCNSDDIEGVVGVGEKGAAQWVRGKLKPGAWKFERILEQTPLIHSNRPLVTIPYEGAEDVTLRNDKVTAERWDKLAKRLGMSSLIGRGPRELRKKKNGRKGFRV